MTWYYADAGKQVGPLSEEQFQQLVQANTIRGETLVWRQGMANWQPYREVSGAPEAPASTPPAAQSLGGVVCAECRQSFPLDQVVRFGDTFVCAGCKPLFVQKVREGVAWGASSLGGRRPKPVNPDALVAEIRSRGYSIELGACISRAWELLKRRFWLMVGTTALVMCVVQVAGAIPFLGILISLALNGPLMGGLYVFYLKLIRDEPANVGDGFAGFSKMFVPLMLNVLLVALVAYIWFLPGIILGVVTGGFEAPQGPDFVVLLVILAGILPAAFFGVASAFCMPLIVDLELGPLDALMVSIKVTTMHWFSVFALMLVCGLIAGLGVLACCVGVFVTLPIFYAALCYAYEDIFSPRESIQS